MHPFIAILYLSFYPLPSPHPPSPLLIIKNTQAHPSRNAGAPRFAFKLRPASCRDTAPAGSWSPRWGARRAASSLPLTVLIYARPRRHGAPVSFSFHLFISSISAAPPYYDRTRRRVDTNSLPSISNRNLIHLFLRRSPLAPQPPPHLTSPSHPFSSFHHLPPLVSLPVFRVQILLPPSRKTRVPAAFLHLQISAFLSRQGGAPVAPFLSTSSWIVLGCSRALGRSLARDRSASSYSSIQFIPPFLIFFSPFSFCLPFLILSFDDKSLRRRRFCSLAASSPPFVPLPISSFDLLVWSRLVAADVRWPLCTIGFTTSAALQRRAPHVGPATWLLPYVSHLMRARLCVALVRLCVVRVPSRA
ncbi:hypothetical protein C8J57DRAFT_1721011 [Mycena rebaudengoi]|nr:hypothetical protein C8J57DRAFT_1721011 [Mycena rebaudengoi]